MKATHRRTLGPDNEPLWVRRYVHPVGDHWTALMVGDEVPPSDPRLRTGLTFFGATPEDAEQAAKAYRGLAEPAH